MRIQAVSQLTPQQLDDVEALHATCRAVDGNVVPIYRHLLEHARPFPCNVLAYEEGHLIGFLRGFFFYEHHAELSVMVAPNHRRQQVATTMFRTLLPLLRHQQVQRISVSMPHGFAPSWLASLGFELKSTQHQMQYLAHSLPPRGHLDACIRLATQEDLPCLIAIHRAGFPNENNELEDHLASLFGDPQYLIFVLQQTHLPVGKAHIRFQSDSTYLADIAVLSKHQRKGYGRALITHCLHYLSIHRPETRILLDVESHNTHAKALYHDLGFTMINTHEEWIRTIDLNEFNLTNFLHNLV